MKRYKVLMNMILASILFLSNVPSTTFASTISSQETLIAPSLDGNTAIEGSYYKGSAPNASKVVLKTTSPNGDKVWHEIFVNNGRFAINVPRTTKGDVLELFSFNDNQTSEMVQYTIQPSFWFAKPIVFPVSPGDTVVKGTASPETDVVIEKENQQIGKGTSLKSGEFEIEVSSQLVEGDILAIYSTSGDQKTENTIEKVDTRQDRLAPEFMDVKLEPYNQESVIGVTEPGAIVQVRVNNLFIDQQVADPTGRFNVMLFDTQQGDIVEATVVDTEGNRSEPTIFIVKDYLKPNIHPKRFSNADMFYNGRSESGVTILVKSENNTLIASGTTDEFGLYSIPIPPQTAGTWLKVEAVDSSGNIGRVEQLVVDLLPPTIDNVATVYQGDTQIEGKTEPNSTVTLWINDVQYPSIQANNLGLFTISVPVLKAGDVIKVVAVDNSKNSSDPYTTEALPLIKPESPAVDVVSDQSPNITGKTIPSRKVRVYKGNSLLKEGTSLINGDFNIEIPIQSAGTQLTVVALNERNQEGDPTVITVVDKTAPVAPNIISTVTDQTRKINGTAEPLSTVVIMEDEKPISEVKANEQGEFTADIPFLKANSELKVYAHDKAGNKSLSSIVKVKDVTAPTVSINPITNLSTTVTGVANETGIVEVKKGTELINKTSVLANQPFTMNIPFQKEGVTLSIIGTDEAGNSSIPITYIVKDVIAPVAPQVNKVTNIAKEITGKAETGTTVRVFAGTKQLGYATSNGSFKVVIPVQPEGVTLSVKAYDKSGNISKETNVKVLDVVAPGKPTFNPIKNNMTTVSGKAERGAIVRLYSGTKLLGYSTATSIGTFSIRIPIQKAGGKLTATATDPSGNKSVTVYMTVLDGTAPAAPRVNAVYSKSYYVTGKTEAYSTVKVKRGSTVIGSAKADRYGNFKVKISRQKRGVTLGITSTDASRNESKPTSIKVR